MQISLKWINELINVKIVNLDDLINKLTLGGFEVEEILEVEIDNQKTIALEISATANRSDSLSIQGLSLEVAALLDESFNFSKYSTENFSWAQKIQTLSQNFLKNKNCSAFIALTVENLNILIPPKWLKQKLIRSGIAPENSFKDFQNYIMLETGYPFEFYDLEKIYLQSKSSKFHFTLTNGKMIKHFSAANGTKYLVDESILVLKANNIPISLAGIIPSEAISCSNTTKSLVIEGSIFNAAKIRQQSRKLGLRTERSSRYEKSLKNTNLIEACYRLVSLLRIKNPNLTLNLHTIVQPVKEFSQTIKLNYKTINEVLGPIAKNSNDDYEYLSPQKITDSLTRLQFNVKYNKINHSWDVQVPILRNEDIILEIDLIEEIARIYGFNNFLTRLPKIMKVGNEDFAYQTRKKLTSCLVNLGFNELVQYSLVNEKTYLKNEIQLVNPLVKDYANLRFSLLPNLLKAVQENSKNDKSRLEGFEYGHVFSGNILDQLTEKEHVAGIFGGIPIKSRWSDSFKTLNWFEAKGRIEGLFKKLNLSTNWNSYLPREEKEILHPYRTSEIYLTNGVRLGIFGQIHPLISRRLGISSDFYLFEFNFEFLKRQIQQNKLTVYKGYSVYPKIIKNLSFIINNKISFENLKEILYLNGSKLLIDLILLDEYKSNEVPKDHISLCLQFTFQSDQETLQTKKVETILENLKQILILKFNVVFRE